MPVFNKLPFRRRKPDSSIKDSDHVWYIESTNEVFANYDDFFDRYIQMNSMCWTCAVTGKQGLTFDEAKESEQEAVKAVEDSFPKSLAVPLLWLAHNFCYRGKLDDMVNDIYVVSRDRYFIGETVWYQKSETQRHKGKIIAVEYDAAKDVLLKADKKDTVKERKSHESEDEEPTANENGSGPKKKTVIKPEDPEMPHPGAYVYSFRAFEDDENDEDSLKTGLEHTTLSRPKAVGSRVKMRLFMKKLTEIRGDKFIIPRKTIDRYNLSNRNWEEFFTGPLPEFPKSERRKPFTSEQKRKAQSPPQSPTAPKKPRASRTPKVSKEVRQQQENLKELFNVARSFHIENLSKWEQTQRVLSDAEVDELRELIKTADEEKKEREKERRQKAKEDLAALRRPRDDLCCDDLKPLPELKPLELPSYLTPELFSHVLSISQFFHTFPEYFDDTITLNDCILAIFGKDYKNDSLVKLITALLKARSICIEKEDGDEANIRSYEDMSNETYAVFNNKRHGARITELNKLHEKLRILHRESPPYLPVNWMSISEVLRLNLITSGYCPMGSIYHTRATKRGGIHCYEDPVYLHLLNDPTISDKLTTSSIFDLTIDERFTLIDVLCDQLLTFATFRDTQEERIVKLPELRRQVKHLKIWDQEQEKASRIAAYSADENNSVVKESKDKTVIKLKAYLKAVRENKRGIDHSEVKDIFLAALPFDNFTGDEVRELREIQKSFVEEKLEELRVENFQTFSKLGNGFLGRDRAYRSYHYFEQYPLILVENTENPGECGAPTPMREGTSDTEAIQAVMGCTGSAESCPVHRANRPRWMYLAHDGDIEKLIEACNPRGHREIELADALASFKPWLSSAVNDLAAMLQKGAETGVDEATKIEPMEEDENKEVNNDVKTNGQAKKENSIENGLDKDESDRRTRSKSKSNTPDSTNSSGRKKKSKEVIKTVAEFMGLRELPQHEEFTSDILALELRNLLTDFTKRIDLHALGEIAFNENQTKEDFLHALDAGESLKPFMTDDDLKVHCFEDENILTKEQLDELPDNDLTQIILGFIKIMHAIRIKFIKAPYTVTEQEKTGNVIYPARPFVSWQQALPLCESLSAAALFITSFENAVQWSAIKTMQKCAICRRKTQVEDSVVCDGCGGQYHLQCTPVEVTSRVGWLCKACARRAGPKKKKQVKAPTPEPVYDEEEEEEETEESPEEDDDEQDEYGKNNINMDDVYRTSDSPVDDNNSSVENHDEGRRSRRPRQVTKRPVDYSELADISGGENRRSQRRAAREENAEAINYRAISMGLRGSNKDFKSCF